MAPAAKVGGVGTRWSSLYASCFACGEGAAGGSGQNDGFAIVAEPLHPFCTHMNTVIIGTL